MIGGIIFCGSKQGQLNWVHRLNKLHPSKFNYFVFFNDVQGPAVQFGYADWVLDERGANGIYINL